MTFLKWTESAWRCVLVVIQPGPAVESRLRGFAIGNGWRGSQRRISAEQLNRDQYDSVSTGGKTTDLANRGQILAYAKRTGSRHMKLVGIAANAQVPVNTYFDIINKEEERHLKLVIQTNALPWIWHLSQIRLRDTLESKLQLKSKVWSIWLFRVLNTVG